MIFEGGADSFFHKGENDRGKQLLSAAQLERVERHVTDGLAADAATWLANGNGNGA